MMLGLHAPDEGTLTVLGLDPTHVGPEVRSRLGYSPEHHEVPPDVRAVDFVRHLGEVHGLPHREATNRASDVLWLVGLGEERFRPLGTMSTGQRQRVKLAQALVHDPALLLLDEPTDGLDPVQRDDMLPIIRRIDTTFGIDVVLSSHLLEEVERICDAAVILRDGRVVTAWWSTSTAARRRRGPWPRCSWPEGPTSSARPAASWSGRARHWGPTPMPRPCSTSCAMPWSTPAPASGAWARGP